MHVVLERLILSPSTCIASMVWLKRLVHGSSWRVAVQGLRCSDQEQARMQQAALMVHWVLLDTCKLPRSVMVMMVQLHEQQMKPAQASTACKQQKSPRL